MDFNVRLIIAITLSQALVCGACGLEIGGGASALVGPEGTAQGSFVADDNGARSDVITLGPIPHVDELRYVQDSTGKRAEMSFNVTGAVGSVKYTASLSPKEGTASKAYSGISATQILTVPGADSIRLHAAAQSAPGSDEVEANLAIMRTGPSSPASFSGTTKSTASTTSTLARIQGRVVGSINGNASYGGPEGGPYNVSKTRDSLGQKVDCSLLLQASSVKGSGALGSVSTFTVDVLTNKMIQGAINAAWNGDTINVAKGTYKENIVLDKSVTIKGAGSSKTVVDGIDSGSVFTIGVSNPGATVVMSGMKIQNGSAVKGGGIYNNGTLSASSCIISDNRASSNGGGVYNSGTATLSSCAVSGNEIAGSFSGGGVYSKGKITLSSCTVSGNKARFGAGVYTAGTATLSKSSIINNNAESFGGGVYSSGTTTISRSTISGNRASDGAGIYNIYGGLNNPGILTITSSTISKNTATTCGGGIYSRGTTTTTSNKITENNAAYGGGIYHLNGLLTVDKNTITKNSAQTGGGVCSDSYDKMSIESSSISANKATYMGGGMYSSCMTYITGSTFTGNTADYGGAIVNNRTTITLTKNTISNNKATYLGGGIYSYSGKLISASGTITGNKAASGGGIYSLGELFLGGSSSVTSNQAITGYGGGIYSADSNVTFDGTRASVRNNKAYLPPSASTWDQGYGVYLVNCTISTTNGFNPAKQITGNRKA